MYISLKAKWIEKWYCNNNSSLLSTVKLSVKYIDCIVPDNSHIVLNVQRSVDNNNLFVLIECKTNTL